MDKATLRLFNAILIPPTKKEVQNNFLEETVPLGFMLSPEVAKIADELLIKDISDVVGISGEKANSTFHKSWRKVQDADIEQLVIEQIMHYITTYGFERFGIYHDDFVFIPRENLDLPEITEDIRLTLIKGWSPERMIEEIAKLSSGIALKESTLDDIMTIIDNMYKANDCNQSIIHEIKNRELLIRLYDYFDMVPEDPVEYLRYIVTRLTNDSLLIKSDSLIRKIKLCDSKLHEKTLNKLLAQAPDNLASIFFRFKPIFLALKSISKDKGFFNRLRKRADKLHRPMPVDYLNNVTAIIKSGEKIVLKELRGALSKVNIYRKIRLAYALKYRTEDYASILYRVRNGKGFSTEFNFNYQDEADRVLNKVVLPAIAKDLDLKGKTIYLPDEINYALPATEKQFTGHIPSGSYVSIPGKNLVVGAHWTDNDGGRVDLDISLLRPSGKIGWDGGYRNENGNILFSGDNTSAPKPKGAAEFLHIKTMEDEPGLLMINFFNHRSNSPVDTKIIVASENPSNFGKDYMVDVNNIIAQANLKFENRQAILGLVHEVDGENRFYFVNVEMGQGVSAHGSLDYFVQAREALVNSAVSSIGLRDVLELTKVNIVAERPEDPEEEYIDLSPESLDKNTFIKLLNNE